MRRGIGVRKNSQIIISHAICEAIAELSAKYGNRGFCLNNDFMKFQAIVPVVSKSACGAAYNPVSKVPISDDQICAGNGQADTCSGDSGGPMLSDQFGTFSVIGVTSFGVSCSDSTFPGVYTRVDRYLDWIATNTK